MIDVTIWPKEGEYESVSAAMKLQPGDATFLVVGEGKSRNLAKAVAYALEDLAAKIIKEVSR